MASKESSGKTCGTDVLEKTWHQKYSSEEKLRHKVVLGKCGNVQESSRARFENILGNSRMLGNVL